MTPYDEIVEELYEREIPIPKDESIVYLFGEQFNIQEQLEIIKEYLRIDE